MDQPVDKTIGNPASWAARQLWRGSAHVAASAQDLGGRDGARAVSEGEIATLTLDDLRASLQAGWQDLLASRADALFLCIVYPVLGVCLIVLAIQQSFLPLVFPLLSGFVLIGPLAALGLYEMSRRREAGKPVNWASAFAVMGSPSFASLVLLGLYLVALMVIWLFAARAIYDATFGPAPPAGMASFAAELFTTGAGWTLIIVGCAVGAVFAVTVLATSVISFPLLLDRSVGVPNAVVTSVRVCRKNARVMLVWGMLVAVGLLLGALPALVGLAIMLPLFGHATWHLYRRAVKPETTAL